MIIKVRAAGGVYTELYKNFRDTLTPAWRENTGYKNLMPWPISIVKWLQQIGYKVEYHGGEEFDDISIIIDEKDFFKMMLKGK